MDVSEVAVVHMDLTSKGGGEAVAMNTIEALQDDHTVTLLTLTDPNISSLNDYFNTGVNPTSLDVRRAGWVAPALHEQCGLKYYILQNALLGRYARKHADEYDLLVSTINELGLETDSVQYVHFPFDWTVSSSDREHIFHPTVEEESLYERVCTRLAGVSLEDIKENTLFANSTWTADVVEDAYGTRPEVLYPPIATGEFTDRSWAARETGFVTVGRIERSKRIIDLIEIIDGVRERGHDVHLHIVGPTVDEEYYEEVTSVVDERSYIELEGELPREDLVELLCTHRYGIQGKEYEHFGMAVAELAAGGALPFVPNNGGQHAIVRDEQRLLYESVSDAIETVDYLLSNPEQARELRMGPDEIDRRFGCERFKRRMRDAVREALQSAESDAASETADAVTQTVPGSTVGDP